MAKLEFNGNDRPTLGVELELGLVDADTMELASRCQDLLQQLPDDEAVYKPELMQCCIEINSGVCQNVDEVKADLTSKLSLVRSAADDLGLRLWWGATHPNSQWKNQQVTPTDRYRDLVNLLQEMARRLVTFGLHIHVGVESGDKAVMICDRMMQHLPMLLALSCSSPIWECRDTGLHSHRSKIMEGLPTAGLPTLMRNWSEYVWIVRHMVDTGFINTIREIWWDIRPHHKFGTVEVRVCDMPGRLTDVLAITALVQCLVQALSSQIDSGQYQHDCHPMMVQQNKWRACRFGNQARLVNSYSYEVQTVAESIASLTKLLEPTAEELNCSAYLQDVQRLASEPDWATLQRTTLKQTGSPAAMVRELTAISRDSF